MSRSLCLAFISGHAASLAHHANGVTRFAAGLPSAPPFETDAEDQLRCAESELEQALLAVRAALVSIEGMRNQSQAAE